LLSLTDNSHIAEAQPAGYINTLTKHTPGPALTLTHGDHHWDPCPDHGTNLVRRRGRHPAAGKFLTGAGDVWPLRTEATYQPVRLVVRLVLHSVKDSQALTCAAVCGLAEQQRLQRCSESSRDAVRHWPSGSQTDKQPYSAQTAELALLPTGCRRHTVPLYDSLAIMPHIDYGPGEGGIQAPNAPGATCSFCARLAQVG
jgi:hypothetical protein